jgi:O-antigen ligase
VGGYLAFGAETFTDRLASFLPGSQSSFSATNTDHINDIIDAYHAGRDNILLGLGMGHYYETTLITRWKTESFEVHNAVVQAWLKFGLLGAIAYVAFHFRWALAALRAPVSDDAERHSLVAVGIYIGAEFVSMLSATWPYNSFQQAVHHGLLLGAVLAVAAPRLGSSPPVPEPIRAGV